MIICKNNIDPPSEQRDALTEIEVLKNKLANAKQERNAICARIKKLKRRLSVSETRYNQKYGGYDGDTRG